MIPALREYLILDQDTRQVDIYRYPEGTHEVCSAGSVRLNCLDTEVSVDDIYAELTDASPPLPEDTIPAAQQQLPARQIPS